MRKRPIFDAVTTNQKTSKDLTMNGLPPALRAPPIKCHRASPARVLTRFLIYSCPDRHQEWRHPVQPSYD